MVLALAACGSASPPELPPPADRARDRVVLESDPSREAVLDARARVVRLDGQEAPAGTGPARIASEGDRLYVTDLANDGLLVLQTRPRLRVTRRLALPGGPLAMAKYRDDLVVALTEAGAVVRVTGESRPAVIARVEVPGVREVKPVPGGVRAIARDGRSRTIGARELRRTL